MSFSTKFNEDNVKANLSKQLRNKNTKNEEENDKPKKQKINIVINKSPKKEIKKNYIFTLKPSAKEKLNEKAKEYGYVHSNGKGNVSQFLESIINQL